MDKGVTHLLKIYNKLIELAKNKKVISYQTLADELGIRYENSKDRNLFHEILGQISCFEVEEMNRPMLSAVVTLKDSKPPYPGDGFFELAEEIERKQPSEGNEEFYREELKNLFDYWST